jgi:chorismate mutase
MDVVNEIGHYKKENNITVLQLKRWNEILRDRLHRGKQLGMSADFIQYLLEIIHTESIRRQTDIFHGNNRED